MRIIAIIQARVGSTRLPRKVLFDLAGKTVLERVIERVRISRFVDDIVLATTVNKEDLEIVKICSFNGISVYCGCEQDVLDRYFQAARLFQADHIVRITADCPLIDAKIIDGVIKLHLSKKNDYTSNVLKRTYPDGQDIEVFTFQALKKAWKNASLLSEREHVTPYIRNHPNIFRLENLEYKVDLSQKRWTLDKKEDYELIKRIFNKLYRSNPRFGMQAIIDFVNKNPKLEKINRHLKTNAGYLKSLKKDRALKPRDWE